jgi:hypothetical protein
MKRLVSVLLAACVATLPAVATANVKLRTDKVQDVLVACELVRRGPGTDEEKGQQLIAWAGSDASRVLRTCIQYQTMMFNNEQDPLVVQVKLDADAAAAAQ